MKVFTSGGTEMRSACGRMMSQVRRQNGSASACAASYWPRGIACRPPRTTSARYAAANRIIAICARSSLSIVTPEGRKSGSITEAMNSSEISGTPRISSM